MSLVILDVKIEKKHWIWSEEWLRGKWAGIKKAAMASLARYWLETCFPRHFRPGNVQAYGMEPRTKGYQRYKIRVGSADGKHAALILTGKSRRWLRSFARITSTANKATLSMTGPTYFSNPFVGISEREIQDQNGKTRRITIKMGRQPNKPKELTAFNEQDMQGLRRHFETESYALIKQAIASSP